MTFIHLSFIRLLPLLTFILTGIYLVMLFNASGHPQPKRSIKLHRLASTHSQSHGQLLMFVIFVLITFILLHLPSFKLSIYYLILIGLIFTLFFAIYIVVFLRNSMNFSGPSLFLVILMQLTIIYNPPSRVYFGEWIGTLTKTYLTGHYELELIRFTYNPFPAHIGLRTIISEVTNLSLIQGASRFFLSLICLLIIDIILYSIVKEVTNDWKAGILAILLYAITPPANFLDHIAELAAAMLILILTLMILSYFKTHQSFRGKILIISLTYIAAIFYHASAGLGMFIIAGLTASGLLTSRSLRKRTYWNKFYKKKELTLILTLLIIITLIKWTWGGGAEEVFPSLYSHLLIMLQLRKNVGGGYPPLYERSGVNPFQAYAWAMPVAMAISLILFALLKKYDSYDSLTPSLAVGALVFLFMGFISSYLQTGLTGVAYPGYLLIIPSAAIVAYILLGSQRSFITLFTIFILLLSAVVAARDPMNMPGGWVKLKGFEIADQEQLIVTSSIHRFLVTRKFYEIFLAGELSQVMRFIDPYLESHGIWYEPSDPKYCRGYDIAQGNLEKATYYVFRSNQIERFFINGILGNTTVNVFFNSKKYLFLVKT